MRISDWSSDVCSSDLKYLLATEVLGAAGLDSYEISNWSKPGHECRHNLLYWTMGEYQGIGCASHSHRDGRRFWNLRTPDRYIAAVESGATVEAADERLPEPARRLEALQLSIDRKSTRLNSSH